MKHCYRCGESKDDYRFGQINLIGTNGVSDVSGRQ